MENSAPNTNMHDNDFEKNGKIILFIDITWKIVHLIQTCTIWYLC